VRCLSLIVDVTFRLQTLVVSKGNAGKAGTPFEGVDAKKGATGMGVIKIFLIEPGGDAGGLRKVIERVIYFPVFRKGRSDIGEVFDKE